MGVSAQEHKGVMLFTVPVDVGSIVSTYGFLLSQE